MKTSVIVVGITASALVIGVAGCGNNKSSSTSASSSASPSSKSATSSSTAAQPADYTNLLINASDIPGDQFTMQEPQLNPNGKPGVAALFANPGETRQIGDTIMVLPSASDVSAALETTKAAAGLSVAGAQPQPIDVGTGGSALAGTSPDGSKAVTILLFSEGRAVVTLEFDSAANDPVPQDGAIEIAQKQDAAIKASLPG